MTSNANAFSVGIGIAEWDVDGSGTENVQGVNDNTGTHSETISGVPSIFVESEPNNGWVFGLDFIVQILMGILYGQVVKMSDLGTGLLDKD